MKKEFKTEITSVLSYSFEISEDGMYIITIRASCKPGWRNGWWITFKGFLENILDLHLDDEDLRVEIDDQVFRKLKGKKGLFNRATYALYRYTPHIAGADLFYRVYAQFFGRDDLGGKI